jgi:aminoglycoside 6'-N-acetyltransferase
MPYGFRTPTLADMPMLRGWLNTPEVVRWWGDPIEQEALLWEDLGNALMTMRIVSLEERPFAYAQDYDVGSWPQPHFKALPPGARAIDAFIGEPDMIGRGHGSGFLRELALGLLADGATVVAIDPDEGNLRARRAYARAGFVGDQVAQTPDGPAVVMLFAG